MSSSNNNNNDNSRLESCLKNPPNPQTTNSTGVNDQVPPATAQVKHHQHRHNVKSRYEFLQTLGRGTYGKVKLARHKESNRYVAIKAIRKDKIGQFNMTHIRREMEIVSQIHHPNIIKIYEVFENQEKIVIVMEYAAGGELYDYISNKRHLDETETKHIFRQIVSAVRYCHKQGIVHRDLKLENILLDKNNKIKIADFGLANRFKEDSKLKTFCGSPLYASPEIVTGTPYNGPEVDSWSLGVLLYALVYGTMPFDSNNYNTLSKKITEGKFVQPIVPSSAQDLIEWLLQVDPNKRATIDEVAQHKWLLKPQPPCDDVIKNTSSNSSSDETTYVRHNNSQTTTQQYYNQNNTTMSNAPMKSILKQPTIEVTSSPSIMTSSGTAGASVRQTPSSEAELEGQLAVVCGLHARDSLKLKNRVVQGNAAAYKRRLLRAQQNNNHNKRSSNQQQHGDRESGYYSSPERTNLTTSSSSHKSSISSSSSGGEGSPTQSSGVSPQQQHEARCLSSVAAMSLSVKMRPPRQQQISSPTFERLATGDSNSSGGSRPQSTYSDSSILSSDSFTLCSSQFVPPPSPSPSVVEPHVMLDTGRQSSRPVSMPIILPRDTLPTPSVDELERHEAGRLSPKSEQLLRGLERILLLPNGRYRHHLNSAPPAIGGDYNTPLRHGYHPSQVGSPTIPPSYNNTPYNQTYNNMVSSPTYHVNHQQSSSASNQGATSYNSYPATSYNTSPSSNQQYNFQQQQNYNVQTSTQQPQEQQQVDLTNPTPQQFTPPVSPPQYSQVVEQQQSPLLLTDPSSPITSWMFPSADQQQQYKYPPLGGAGVGAISANLTADV